MKSYIEIKDILLKEKNVYNVFVNSNKKTVIIEPVQNENFFDAYDILENYAIFEDGKKYFMIGNRKFKILSFDHFNTTIYELKLKEAI